jgi:hypothetical protein
MKMSLLTIRAPLPRHSECVKDHLIKKRAVFSVFLPNPNNGQPPSLLQRFYRIEDVVEDGDFELLYWPALKS